MTYELWDTAVGAGLVSFDNETEMRSLVNRLLTLHGDKQQDELTLVMLDDDGEVGNSLTGQGLMDWILAETRNRQSPRTSGPDDASRNGNSTESHGNGSKVDKTSKAGVNR